MPPKKRKSNGPGKAEKRNLAADYGWAMAVFNEYPELKKIFNKAVDNGWTAQRFQAEVQDTGWFKKHSDTWRTNKYLAITDPATFGQRVKRMRDSIANRAGSLGIEVGRGQLNQWAKQAILFGWDDGAVANHLARAVDITGKHKTVSGELEATQERLMKYAADQGQAIGGKTAERWLRAIVRGDSTEEEYRAHLRKQAINAFPNWAAEIRQGLTMEEIAEPYRNSMAELLELNPSQLSLRTTPKLKQALSQRNKDGDFQSMTMYDWERSLRKDRRWQYTDNAKETVNGVVASLGEAFGYVA